MSEQTQKNDSDFIARLSFVIGMIFALLGKTIWNGLSNKSIWTKSTIKFWVLYFAPIRSTPCRSHQAVSWWDPSWPWACMTSVAGVSRAWHPNWARP